jgi:hypothetical protein
MSMSRSNREFQLSLSHQKTCASFRAQNRPTMARLLCGAGLPRRVPSAWPVPSSPSLRSGCGGSCGARTHHACDPDPNRFRPDRFSESCPEPVLAKSAFSHQNRGHTTEVSCVRTHRARTSHTRCHAIYSGSVWCPGFISATPSTAAAELSHCAHLHPSARLHSTDALTTSPLLPVLLAVRFL